MKSILANVDFLSGIHIQRLEQFRQRLSTAWRKYRSGIAGFVIGALLISFVFINMSRPPVNIIKTSSTTTTDAIMINDWTLFFFNYTGNASSGSFGKMEGFSFSINGISSIASFVVGFTVLTEGTILYDYGVFVFNPDGSYAECLENRTSLTGFDLIAVDVSSITTNWFAIVAIGHTNATMRVDFTVAVILK